MANEMLQDVVTSVPSLAEVAGAGEGATTGPAEGGTTTASGQPEVGDAEGVGQADKKESRFELRASRQAAKDLEGEYYALNPSDLIVVRVDLQKMAALVLTLAWRDSSPERRAVFERYAAQGIYDMRVLDRLPRMARAAWYVRRQQRRALFAASGASLAKDEVALAYEVRARMIGVITHWLGDRHDIATDLAHLREGSGHQDLANDLETLSEIYQRADVRSLLEHDIKHYRATDPDEAVRLAERLMASMGLTEEGEAERMTGLARRAATLLVRNYDEHAHGGRFFFGKSENVAVTYPSLYAAARAPQRRRPTDEPVVEVPGDDEPAGGDEPVGEGADSEG
jgi:hypothetical protein